MEFYEGIFDGEFIENREGSYTKILRQKVEELSNTLNHMKDLNAAREVYTDILLDDEVSNILLELSSEQCFLRDFPEFYIKNKYGEDVINCTQNTSYHRYGVFKHILTTIEEVGKNNRTLGKYQRKILKWTMLLHDIGKPFVKEVTDQNRESFAGHDDMSVVLAEPILTRFGFDEQEKSLILTLINYHDKYLNEGEIIYDNLKNLAVELKNDRDNFYLLMEVKDADASAKSIEVYNKYQLTRKKYLEFVGTYFETLIMNSRDHESDQITEEKEEELTEMEYDALLEEVSNKNKITCMYQPIVHIEEKNVLGYEVFSKIEYYKDINIDKFISYAQKTKKYDFIEQALFINALSTFDENRTSKQKMAFFNINLQSFENYVNKPRIYDYMEKFELVMDFQCYDRYDTVSLQNWINLIHQKNGKVCLDNFGIGIASLDDLKILKPDYLKLDRSIIREINLSEEKQKFISDAVLMCVAKNIKLIAVGMETQEEYHTLEKLGIQYMQGYYLSKPKMMMEEMTEKLFKIVNDSTNDSIV